MTSAVFKQLSIRTYSAEVTIKNKSDKDCLSFTSATFNLAAYANKSETLKQFVELGVDLSKIEKKKGLPQFLLQLDFNDNVKPHLFFLHDLGVPAEAFGFIFTKNPLLFKQSIDDLQTRVYYLQSKRFSTLDVQRIVSKNPFWLNFSTRRVDRRLGWFQKELQMTGDEVRELSVKQPKLITYNLEHVRKTIFLIREEMGFDKIETKMLFLSKPNLIMQSELKFFYGFFRKILLFTRPHRAHR